MLTGITTLTGNGADGCRSLFLPGFAGPTLSVVKVDWNR